MKFFERMEQEAGVFLNDVQKQAVVHTEGALLLLASPGSGKTTTINMRIGYLIHELEVDPSTILAVTFSKASAEDMKKRFQTYFPYLPSDCVKFSTIHSLAYGLVREYCRKINISYQLIEGEIDKESLEKRDGDGEHQPIYKKMVLRNLYQETVGNNITEEQMEELLTYISYIKNKLIPSDQLKSVKTSLKSADLIYQAYEAFKRKDPKHLLVDYDDMLTLAHGILEKDDMLLRKYQHKYAYILTDESQDNSLVQNKIMEKLVQAKGNICVVADDDQTLYTWRGAEPSYLLNFKEIYPSARILTMEHNYRSSKDIVDVSNRFIKRNKDRYDKNMFTHNHEDKPILIKSLPTYEAQIQYIVEEIKKEEHLGETAVLYRNNASSIALINELEYEGIPFYIKDSDNRFFNHWLVGDILNFMRMTYSDKHVSILEKVYTKFNGYISKQQLAFLQGLDNKESVFDNLINHLELPPYQVKQLQTCKETFQEMNSMKPQKAIQVIRHKLGYEKKIGDMAERLGFKKEVLLGMLGTLESIAKNLDNLKEFADRLVHLESSMKASKFNKHHNAVTLSTLHSSKGLEYNRVFMIDLVNGVIPSNDNIKTYQDGDPADMEEAARLFYVGMTRAKSHLELLSYLKKEGETLQESIFIRDVKQIISPSKPTVHTSYQKMSNKEPAPQNPNAIKRIADFEVGVEVKHATFGVGKIARADGKVIEICFGSSGVKHLSIDVCIQKGLLELATPAVSPHFP